MLYSFCHAQHSVTKTLNESLAAHAQIMSLINLQKSMTNLPFSLIVPGRTLIRRATMVKVDRGSDRRVRDLLLFSDCLIWISRGGEREDWGVLGELAAGLESAGQSVLLPMRRESMMSLDSSIPAATRGGLAHAYDSSVFNESRVRGATTREGEGPGLAVDSSNGNAHNPNLPKDKNSNRNESGVFIGLGEPPSSARGTRQTGRTRSRSDADALPTSFRPSSSASTNYVPSPDPSLLRPQSSRREDFDQAHGSEERWWYRGRAELLDIEVVISPIISSPGEERMLEILSPEGSFSLYTG